MNAFSCLVNQVSACIPVGGKYYQIAVFLSSTVALDNKFLAVCFTVYSSGSQTGGESQLLSKVICVFWEMQNQYQYYYVHCKIR